MLIHAGPHSHTADDLGKGTAGALATRLATEHGVAGSNFTLKVDGEVLPTNATLPKTARVVELVEQPLATGGTINPPTPEADAASE